MSTRSPGCRLGHRDRRLRCGVRSERLEDEHLDGDVRVDVVIAHETDHLASHQPLDLLAAAVAHHPLPAPAEIQHRLALTRPNQGPLPTRERVLQHHEHRVIAQRRPRLRRASTGGTGQLTNHRVGDRHRKFALARNSVLSHASPRSRLRWPQTFGRAATTRVSAPTRRAAPRRRSQPRRTKRVSDRPLMPLSPGHARPPTSSLDLSAAFSRLSTAISRRAAASSCASPASATPSRDSRLADAGRSSTVANCAATTDKPGPLDPLPRLWDLSGRTNGPAFPFALRRTRQHAQSVSTTPLVSPAYSHRPSAQPQIRKLEGVLPE